MRSKEISEIDVAIWRKGGKANLNEACTVYLRMTIGSVLRDCSHFAKRKTSTVVMLINEAQVTGTERPFYYFISFP